MVPSPPFATAALSDAPDQLQRFLIHGVRRHGFSRATVRTYLSDGAPMSISTDFSTRHEQAADALHVDWHTALDRVAEGNCPIHDVPLVRVGEWGHCRPCSRHWRTHPLGAVQVIDLEECPSVLDPVWCPGVADVP